MSNLEKIFVSDQITIHHIAATLKENNIQSIIKNHRESANIAGFGAPDNNVELFVQESDKEEALQILKDLDLA